MGVFLLHYLFFSFILHPPGCYWMITLLGTLSKHDDDGSENVGKKWICVLSNLIASIWTRWICQIQATFPGVEFLRTFFSFEKSSKCLWRPLHDHDVKPPNLTFYGGRGHTTTNFTCTKKRDARAELLFWRLNLLFFWSRRCDRRRSCLRSLLLTYGIKIIQTLSLKQWLKRSDGCKRVSVSAIIQGAGARTNSIRKKILQRSIDVSHK